MYSMGHSELTGNGLCMSKESKANERVVLETLGALSRNCFVLL